MTQLRPMAIGALLMFALVMTPDVFAQTSEIDLQEELKALKTGQEAILKELQSIKQLLQTRPRARRQAPNVRDVVFDLGANPFKGTSTAPLTLIEFTDYQ